MGAQETSGGALSNAERESALLRPEGAGLAALSDRDDAGTRTEISGAGGIRMIPITADEQQQPAESQPPRIMGRVLTAALVGDLRKGRERLIEGATVAYRTVDPYNLSLDEEATEVLTDGEGRFALPVKIGGTNRLSFRADGHVSYALEAGPVHSDLELGDIVLQAASIVTGRVQDSEGNAVAGARILRHDPSTDTLRPDRWETIDQVLAVTDSRGGFTVPVAPVGALFTSYSLAVHHAEFRPKIHTGQLGAGAGSRAPITITLAAGARVHGKIIGVDPSELGSMGPLVVGVAPRSRLEYIEDDWDYDSSYRRVLVDANGRFEVGGLEEGEPVLVAAWTGDVQKDPYSQRRSLWVVARPSLSASVREASAPGYVALPFVPPARVRARLVDEAGHPIERAAIDANPPVQVWSSGQPLDVGEMDSLEGGAVEWVVALNAEAWDKGSDFSAVVEDDEGRAILQWEADTEWLRRGAVFDFGEVVLRVPEPETELKRTVVVTVVDGADEPLADVLVESRKVDSKRRSWMRTDLLGRTEWSVAQDEEHEFQLTGDLFGTQHLRRDSREAALSRAMPWRRVPKGSGAASITLRSPESAEVSLAVTYAGVPLAGAILALHWSPDGYGESKSYNRNEATPEGERTDGMGRWSRARLLPGGWRAFVFHPQLRMPEVFNFTLAPGANSVDLDRSPTALIGRVVDEAGNLIPGALVRPERGRISPLYSQHERDPHRMTPRLGGSRAETPLRDIRYTRVASDGSFRLDGVLPDEKIKAIATAPGYVMATSVIVTALPGETVDLGELRLGRAGGITVLLDEGMDGDVHLRRLFADTEEGALAKDATPDELGSRWSSVFDHLTMDDLPPADWEVVVEYHPSGARDEPIEHEQTVTVRAGETSVIDLRGQSR